MKWRLPWRANGASSGQRIAVTVQQGQIDLVASRNGEIIASRSVMNADLVATVSAFREEAKLQNPACSIVLATGSYQILLVESPPVPAEELAAALRWKVKDLVNLPLEQAVIDGFPLPDDAFRGRQKMAYTVAADRTALQQLVDELKGCELSVDRVLIPELVMAHAVNESLHDENTEVVLVIGRHAGFLCVFAEGSIYLARNVGLSESTLLQIKLDPSRREEILESFLLELQRSRDYFESQMGKGVVGKILVVPTENDCQALCEVIRERMRMNVELIDADEITSGSAAYNVAGAEPLLLASASLAAA
ncbi:MAG: hypothetical protein KJP25_05585 [Gammaproteobacteria bacterium]|nr:hypothetical protein [Gammaproteobacteria bacterium]NND39970.1 hypothetical protein [Pseudomonadales bacterium]NNL11595.1 hypothetical protein [Pseudomonadales bacterium]NNM11001.1 hypothetical protein [Pseudomonadales bacterium]RZV60079.1 MAG: hypothetical protein EX270_00740 [Pseudomonadales bacterium]